MSNFIRPGDTVRTQFTTANSFGQTMNADAAPAGSAYRNLALDSSVSVALTSPNAAEVGLYGFTAAVPSSYQAGDLFTLVALATIAGTPARCVVYENRIDPQFGIPADVQTWKSGTPSGLSGGNVPTAASSSGGGAGTASNYYVTGPLGITQESPQGTDDGVLTLFAGDRRTLVLYLRDGDGQPIPYGQGTVTARVTSAGVTLGGDIGASARYGRGAPFAQFDIGALQTPSGGTYRLTLDQVDGGNEQRFGPITVKVLNP